MKTFNSGCFGLRITLALVLSAAVPAAVLGDGYTLDWWTLDGGGSMFSTGVPFELSGTLGQPDAGPVAMTGGGFELAGGFWAGAAVSQTIHIGDINCDGTYGYLSFGDINPFVQYLSNFSAWQVAYPSCPPQNGDINGDGTYGHLSFEDINPFVALLSTPPGLISGP
jgi:hypothetical protein